MPGYYASGIRAIRSEWQDEGAGVLRAEAVLSLGLPTAYQAEAARLATLGFKMGLLIRDGQCTDADAAVADLVPIMVHFRPTAGLGRAAIDRQRGLKPLFHHCAAEHVSYTSRTTVRRTRGVRRARRRPTLSVFCP